MKKLILISFALVALGCLSESKQAEVKSSKQDPIYLKKYAGEFSVEVDGQSSDREVEVYILDENSEAKWRWVERDESGKVNIKDEKVGTWKAWTDTISIDIESTDILGETEMINETFVKDNGKFREKLIIKRWLKRN